jgi:hypothetical protein
MTILVEVNPARMNAYLKQRRFHLTIEELLEGYQNFVPKFRPDIVDIELDELKQFRCIYEFSSKRAPAMKTELTKYLREHWKYFYGDNWQECGQKMVEARDAYNLANGTEYPFISYIPNYGGLLREEGGRVEKNEKKFRKKKGITYVMGEESLPPPEELNFK